MSFSSFAEVIRFATDFRHELHRHPELTWKEENTSQRIRDVLDRFAIPWEPCTKTGTIARLAPDATGEHIALRTDIDALPMEEGTGLPYTSQHPGCMHACGHDGHAATLIATALWLKQHEAQLPGPITLIIQPAEEGGHGAKAMIDEGCLEGIECIYGWHNWPAIQYGQAICPDGIVMAGNGTFHIELHGKGGHSSQPEICRDPVLAASAVTMALQQIVSRQTSPQKVAVVSVTSIDARSGATTIPDSAKLQGSIRISDNQMRDEIAESIQNITLNVAKAYGVKANVEFRNRYDATVNHPENAHLMREVFRQELGESWRSDHLAPVMASEDFSYYLEQIPGAFALIGSNDGDTRHGIPCHNVQYDFNDRLIETVSRCLIRLAGLSVE